MTWAHEQGMLVKTQARMIQHVTKEHYAVPSGGLSLPVGHIFCVPVCVYVCVHTILHQREIPSLVPEAWGPMFVAVWKQLHWGQSRASYLLHGLWMENRRFHRFQGQQRSLHTSDQGVRDTLMRRGTSLLMGQQPSLLIREMRSVFLLIKWW